MRKRKSQSYKILRLKKGKGSEYDLLDFNLQTNKRLIICPTCGKKCKKGTAIQSSYIHREQSFITRRRFHCSKKCTPLIIKSK